MLKSITESASFMDIYSVPSNNVATPKKKLLRHFICGEWSQFLLPCFLFGCDCGVSLFLPINLYSYYYCFFPFSPLHNSVIHTHSLCTHQKKKKKKEERKRKTMSSPSKRRDMDLMKLMMSDYKVEMMNDGMQEFFVEFRGPKDSPYQDGVWKIRVELPDAYPYKSPSIGFVNKIYHPNVDEMSGSVCLDVINQTWSPMFDLVNVFEVFLPQLLLYPNASDPLNGDAAALMMRDHAAYEQKVKEYCEKYAKPEDIGATQEENSSDDELSEEEYDASSDDAIAGEPDP